MILIKNVVIAIVGIALAIVLYSVFISDRAAPSSMEVEGMATTTPSVEEADDITYRNDTYGITFVYPEGYVMQQVDADNAERRHTTIMLIREEDTMVPESGEGPTAITLDFYRNSGNHMLLTDWLNTEPSNYKLSNGLLASTTVSGVEAVQYQWSGLYQGETTAFLHKDNIVAVSVTYLMPEDQNVAVYRSLLQSLVLH